MSYRCFSGEFKGTLVLAHFDVQAKYVRSKIAAMFADDKKRAGEPAGTFAENWAEARRCGWRVVPVLVSKCGGWTP